jgi:HlyD family secretion protein
MDREISSSERRGRLIRRAGVWLAAVVVAVAALWAFFGWLRPSVRRAEIRTAVVDRGPVEATISASGTVVPAFEQVITSPIDSRVTRILRRPGDRLEPGDPILELDTGEAELACHRLEDQLELKRNERRKAREDLARKVDDWEGQRDIKALELRSLEFEAERCRKNLETGIFSRDELRRAENDAERARIELRQIEAAMDHAAQALETDMEKLDLELAILEKELGEQAHQLRLARAAAEREGVLTWVVDSEGAAVRRGDEIARVADLSAFRVEATVSDVHAGRVSPGLPVIVRSGDLLLDGRVASVRPTVENGVVTMDVDLGEPRHDGLRHNLRVDVFIVTERVADALRIRRGAFLNIEGRRAVFVVRGDRALRTPVTFGITNFETYQVTSGLEEGDEVILSDMSRHLHAREVRLK